MPIFLCQNFPMCGIQWKLLCFLSCFITIENGLSPNFDLLTVLSIPTCVAISLPHFKLNCTHTHFLGSVLLCGGIFILLTPSTRPYQVPIRLNWTPCQYTCFASTVEPRLSNSCLSIPLIIRNDVQKFLKQVIPNCWARDPSFVVYKVSSSKNSKQMCLTVSRQGLTIETRGQIDQVRLSQRCQSRYFHSKSCFNICKTKRFIY